MLEAVSEVLEQDRTLPAGSLILLHLSRSGAVTCCSCDVCAHVHIKNIPQGS